MLTTKTLQELVRLANDGMYDKDIAKQLGIPKQTVSHHRVKAGIHRRGRALHTIYQIYGKDGQYLFEGNVQECSRFLGIKEKTIYGYLSKFRAGRRTPVEIHAEESAIPMRRTGFGSGS